MKHILVATDFSQAAENALTQAGIIAKNADTGIVLFHVKNSHTVKMMASAGRDIEDLETYMAEMCETQTKKYSIPCRPLVKEGSIFSEIPNEAGDPDCVLLVMGTHGSHGLRQKLFGADLLKIARKSSVPVLAMPDNAVKSPDVFKRILFPYGGHEKFDSKIQAVSFLAESLGSEVVLYTIDRYANKVSETTRGQIEKAISIFNERGISHARVRDEMTSFSVGFANQTLAYAKTNKIHLIAVMSTKSDNLSFISEVDREALINNDAGISILLTSDM